MTESEKLNQGSGSIKSEMNDFSKLETKTEATESAKITFAELLEKFPEYKEKLSRFAKEVATLKNVSEDEVKGKLISYYEANKGVAASDAERITIMSNGVKVDYGIPLHVDTSRYVPVKIAEIKDSMNGFSVMGKVLELIDIPQTNNSTSTPFQKGLLGDDTGKIEFVIWEKDLILVNKGDGYRFNNCLAKLNSFNGKLVITVRYIECFPYDGETLSEKKERENREKLREQAEAKAQKKAEQEAKKAEIAKKAPPEPKVTSKSHPYMNTAEELKEKAPFYFDDDGYLWEWNRTHWNLVNSKKENVVIEDKLESELGNVDFFTNQARTGILEAVKIVANRNKPKPVPTNWINTLNGVYDYITGEKFPATPEYFFTAPIPHKIGASTDTPIIDKLFEQWVGKEHVIDLQELASYGLVDDYPIQLIFFIEGPGGNGKGEFMYFLQKYVGFDNTVGSKIKSLIGSEYEMARTYRTKYTFCDETGHDTIYDTDPLKCMSGNGRQIRGRRIYGAPFDFHGTSKLVVLTNDLPPTADKSWSWYRRVFRVVFPNTFKDGKSIVETIPEEEYENFLLKCLKMIPTMLEIGKFTNEKTREEKKLDYERASNRVIEFAEKFCEKVEGCETATYKMCEVFNKKFCPEFGAKEISKEEFNNRLEDAGFEIETKRFDEKDSSGKRKQHMQKFVKSLKLKGVANTEEGELMSPNAILMSALKLFDEEIVSRSITTEPSPLVCGEILASIIKKMGGEIGNKALGEKTIAIEGAVRNIILIRGWKWNPTIVNPQIVTAASL